MSPLVRVTIFCASTGQGGSRSHPLGMRAAVRCFCILQSRLVAGPGAVLSPCPYRQQSAKGEPAPNAKYQQTSYQLTPVRDPYASQIDLHETTESWFVPTMPDLNQHNPHVLRYLIQNSIWWIETIGIDGIRNFKFQPDTGNIVIDEPDKGDYHFHFE